jgi:putative chitinase
MALTVGDLNRIAGNSRYPKRKAMFIAFLADKPSLTAPHVLASFTAQIMQESGRFRYVKEVWGPTAAQKRYEGRAKGLGNTQPGDGKRFMGRDIIQITGRANYRDLTKWVWTIYPDAPDFEKNPERLEDPEWFGIGAWWYWTTRVPKRFVDAGNMEMITRRINGGLNGYGDRLALYDRAALVLLGYGPEDVRQFQKAAGFPEDKIDGLSGPMTRAALHEALLAMSKPQNAHTGPPVRPDVEPPTKPATPAPARKSGGLMAALLAIIAGIFGRKAK